MPCPVDIVIVHDRQCSRYHRADAVATSILYGDTSVPVNSIFEWTYSEPIELATVLRQTNILYDYTVGHTSPGGTLSVSADCANRDVRAAVPTGAGRPVLGRPGQRRGPGRQRRRRCGVYLHDLDGHRRRPRRRLSPPTPAGGLTGVPLNARSVSRSTKRSARRAWRRQCARLGPAVAGGVEDAVGRRPRGDAGADGAAGAEHCAHDLARREGPRRQRDGPRTRSTFTTGPSVDLIKLQRQ